MNLIFNDVSKNRKELEKLYLKSFPKEERFPFWILEECAKGEKSDLFEILDNKKFVGFCYVVDCDDAYYLMYLVVESDLRNKGYGAKILRSLRKKYKTLFLSIEKPTDALSLRRKNFYLNNGFYDTHKFYEDTGVCYEILCTNEEYEIDQNNMLKRYTNMSSDPEIANIIAATFDTKAIDIKTN